VTETWPPYTYSKNGEISGVVTEIIRAALDQSRLNYTIELYPFARAYTMARDGENILIYSILKLPSRSKSFKWIKIDGLSIDMYLFKPQYRTDITIRNLADAKRFRVGVTRQTSTHHYLLSKGFIEGVNLFPVNSEQQNAMKSQPETMRIDLTTGDRLSLACWLKKAQLHPEYWVEQLPLFKEDLYMAFGTATSDEIVNRVRRAFRDIRNSGKLADIIAQYHGLFGPKLPATKTRKAPLRRP